MRASVALTALAVLACPIAQARTLHVPSTYPTVGAALAVAVAGDTVRIAPGRYPESGLTVQGGVTLLGDGPSAEDAWFDGTQSGVPILTIPARVHAVTIRNLAFRNGSGATAGALVVGQPKSHARHTVIDCSFTGNQRAVHASAIDLTDCTFVDNVVTTGKGGAVYAGVLRITGGTFRNNRSAEGGAVFLSSGEVLGARFEGNVAGMRGGAVYTTNASIRECTFVDNVASAVNSGRGGAIYSRSPMPIERCDFRGNHGANAGGAIATESSVRVRRCRFVANTAARGGALHAGYGNLRVEDCALVRNEATEGGGVFAPASAGWSLTMQRVVIQGSTGGAAVAAIPGALPPTIEACDIFGNAGGDWVGPLAGWAYTGSTFSADGLFCEEPADSLFVSGASPLLAANNGLGVDIGAARVGCDPTPLVVASDPPGLTLEVDGVPVALPAAFAWPPGTSHTVAAPAEIEAVPGARWDFQEWSDGGAAAHTVVAPAPPARWTARFARAAVRLDMTVDGGGTVEPAGGWMPVHAPVTIQATPWSIEHRFLGWVGTGPGSYTGPSPSATISMNGPITQHARFEHVGAHDLTMVAGDGGWVMPASGPRTAGTTVMIRAYAEPGRSFVRWIGSGPGSYSGSNITATITMNGDIREEAEFRINDPRQLTMLAETGGSVSPGSGAYPLGTPVTIRALPDPGWGFDRWAGSGTGSYSGPLLSTEIRVLGNITETAHFRWLGPIAPVQIVAVGEGTVSPASGDFTVMLPVHIVATPAPGATFYRWVGEGLGSYTGTSAEANILVLGPMTQTAHFAPAGGYPLVTTATAGGSVHPPSGGFPAGEDVGITASPAIGYRFVEWQGAGLGSYSGGDAHAGVTMHGPITQHAVFEPDGLPHGYELSISASDTDPYANTGAPTGAPRALHLWLTCSLDGIAAFECGVETALPVFGFSPAPGVLNAGTERDLLLAVGECPTGAPLAQRLGTWVVLDTGGEVCLGPSTARGVFGAVDCTSTPSIWDTVRVRGFASGGAAPCIRGTSGCPAGPEGSEGSDGAAVALTATRSALGAIVPNPFREATEVRFSLAAPGRARVAVYDVAGRLLRVLRDGELAAGTHVVEWDGRAAGERAAGGVYFVRFETAGREETRRVVYLGAGRPGGGGRGAGGAGAAGAGSWAVVRAADPVLDGGDGGL